jgi:hypothetical protein
MPLLFERLFLVYTLAAVALWLMLVCAPSWRWTWRVVHSAIPFLLLALAYVGAQALEGDAPAGAGFTSLEGVLLLFSSKEAMLAVWIHFLALDLFAGAWIVRDAARHGIRHLWIVPSLVITFALAPLGLALYLGMRSVRLRSVALHGPGEVPTIRLQVETPVVARAE